eukprot:6416660-Pyramimonas_sp.AAC.1
MLSWGHHVGRRSKTVEVLTYAPVGDQWLASWGPLGVRLCALRGRFGPLVGLSWGHLGAFWRPRRPNRSGSARQQVTLMLILI